MKKTFQEQFGPYALIAGASQGIGEAFAYAAAKRGLNVILIARNEEKLHQMVKDLEHTFGISATAVPLDITSGQTISRVRELKGQYEINLVVYNAALSPIGPFTDTPLDVHNQVIELNCRGPMEFAYEFLPQMYARKKGGVILLSSIAGFQGSPVVAHYSATKAYNLGLAEALWYETRSHGVYVMAVNPGVTTTPGLLSSQPKMDQGVKPPVMTPEAVAEQSLAALPRNIPLFIPGFMNKLSAFFMRHLMSRKMAIKIIGKMNSKMYL